MTIIAKISCYIKDIHTSYPCHNILRKHLFTLHWNSSIKIIWFYAEIYPFTHKKIYNMKNVDYDCKFKCLFYCLLLLNKEVVSINASHSQTRCIDLLPTKFNWWFIEHYNVYLWTVNNFTLLFKVKYFLDYNKNWYIVYKQNILYIHNFR